MCPLPLLSGSSSLSLLVREGMLDLAVSSTGCAVAPGLLRTESVSLSKLLVGRTVAFAATVMLLWGPDSFSGSYESCKPRVSVTVAQCNASKKKGRKLVIPLGGLKMGGLRWGDRWVCLRGKKKRKREKNKRDSKKQGKKRGRTQTKRKYIPCSLWAVAVLKPVP